MNDDHHDLSQNRPTTSPDDGATAPGAGTNSVSRTIARVMDDLFTLPGTNRRFGLDPIIGLIPGVGDAAGAVATAGLVIDGIRHRVPMIVLLRMGLNLLIDMVLGAIPLAGDVFDFAFKANVRNQRLMERAIADREGTAKASKRYLIGAGILLAVLVALMIALTIAAVWGIVALIKAGY